MKKFVIFMMGTMLIFSLILTACSDEPNSPVDVVTVTVINIPATLNGTAMPYKVYVQLSNARSSADTHAAEGRASSGDKSIKLASRVEDIELYMPNGDDPPTYTTPWKGRARYASIVLCPPSASSFEDLEMYGFLSVPNGPNAVFNINDGIPLEKGGDLSPPDSDLDLMFTNTISRDPDPDRPDTP